MTQDLFETTTLDKVFKRHKPESQTYRVLAVLSDFKDHSTFEIMDRLFPGGKAGLFRLGALIFSLKKHFVTHKFPFTISSHGDPDPRKHWYKLERI